MPTFTFGAAQPYSREVEAMAEIIIGQLPAELSGTLTLEIEQSPSDVAQATSISFRFYDDRQPRGERSIVTGCLQDSLDATATAIPKIILATKSISTKVQVMNVNSNYLIHQAKIASVISIAFPDGESKIDFKADHHDHAEPTIHVVTVDLSAPEHRISLGKVWHMLSGALLAAGFRLNGATGESLVSNGIYTLTIQDLTTTTSATQS